MDKAHKFILHAYDEPRNSSYIHMWWTQIQQHSQVSWWTQQHSQVSWRTYQHSDLHCCNPETLWSSECWTKLSINSWWVPGHVAQDYWSLSNGYMRSRNSIKRSGRLNIIHTLQSIQENNIVKVFEALAKIDFTNQLQRFLKS